MSDELNAVPVEPVAGVPEKKPGLLSTPTGKIVAIVVGLGVLVIIAGIAIAIVLAIAGGGLVDDLESQLEEQTTTGTTGSTTTTAAVEAAGPAAEVPNSQVFTFRDIFVPLLKPLPEATASPGTATSGGTPTGGESAPTTDSATPMQDGTLYLLNILGYGDGSSKALLYYNGVEYQLGPGEGIPGTPWQVLRISSSGVVTMLYGDAQVTLSVGQGITK